MAPKSTVLTAHQFSTESMQQLRFNWFYLNKLNFILFEFFCRFERGYTAQLQKL